MNEAVAADVESGAVYDGLIALTCKVAGESLVTRDRRAAATYEAIGVDVRLLEASA